MSFEDLITPEQVAAARGYGEVPPRPPGPPAYGLTEARKVVPLKGLTRSQWLKDPVEQVTASGWPRWFPVTKADFDEARANEDVERNARRKTRRKTRGLLPDGDVNEGDQPHRNIHPWN